MGSASLSGAAANLALDVNFQAVLTQGTRHFELDIQFTFEKGLLVLFGDSGAGKSLTLRALAGLLRPDQGRIECQGQVFFDSDSPLFLPAHQRGVGYVPQHQSLFPFLDVHANVAFGLPAGQRRAGSARVAEVLQELEIDHLAKARPDSLSGGEKQRVALARALAPRPRLLLLDEPFASVDQTGRRTLQRLLAATLKRNEIPAVFVTHDAAEAATLATQTQLLTSGKSRTKSGTGTVSPKLGTGTVFVTGEPEGPAETASAKRYLHLNDAVVELPSSAVVQEGNGRITVEFPTDDVRTDDDR